ncbi:MULTISPECIES: mannose-1-phosphate guanylyltransferase [Halobacterium]|nr:MULTISPECIES: sugar phosphate nucleotidyltransferase [Halobacterium]MCF2239811.1 mannose-1-phosphate guanylyltransferase [Halobacterium salinarum]QRY22352.1 mannose-1-phosphate guanylyltransferase [Halobacterium sp. GSL-19]WJK63721.1 sugar phosphate nucleotidyltransferase [Halobacterium salinarum]
MTHTVAAVLLAGGTGTRLYPASRSHRPKQLLALGDDDRSLLRRTADRAAFADDLLAVTREAYADRVRDEVPEATVLVEPAGKDTGPALAYAASEVRARFGEDAVMLCLPSDHVVGDGFQETAETAVDVAARTDGLVTIGVEPDRPATGYGYIEPGDDHGDHRGVAVFREKPDAETASRLVDRGCLWNAGMFAWTPTAFLDAARSGPLDPLVDALATDADPATAFERVDPVSVDYAVLERAADVRVVPAAFDWDDLGAWNALGRLLDGENAVLGDATTIDATGNVLASDDKHVSVVGVDDLVVAAYDDRVLVVPRADAQRVREVVAALDAPF